MLALLQTAIGVSLLFAVVALMCTSAQEFVAQLLNKRAKELARSLDQMLTKDAADTVREHPLVANQSLSGKLPSYIASDVFAKAFVDTFALAQKLPIAPATLDAALSGLPVPVQRQLRTFLLDGADDADVLLKAVSTWYDRIMSGTSEWYIRFSHRQSFWIGLVMCIALNLDTVNIASVLWTQPAVRDALVAMAEKTPAPTDTTGTADPGATARAMAQQLQAIQIAGGLPLGWSELPATPGAWGLKLIGFFASALALSLGARFWFDALKNLLSLRAANKPPPTTPPAAS
jgi:hypothetical protein